ncbi:MAG: hypothetical protein ACI4WV_06365, partial [Eubacteriales bacterium]
LDRAGEKLCLKQYNGGTKLNTWKFYTTDYYLDHYYDESLAGTSNSVYRQMISAANSFVSYNYNKLFEIDIKTNKRLGYSPSIEGCVSGDSQPCDPVLCGEDCSSHHKNMLHLVYEVGEISRQNNHAVVMWSNRPWTSYCQKVQSDTGEYVHRANQDNDSPKTIAITYGTDIRFYTLGNAQSNSEEIGSLMYIILAHESAHLFGMPEVYYDEEHESQDCFCAMKHYSTTKARDYYITYMRDPDECEYLYCDSCYEDLYQRVFKKFF